MIIEVIPALRLPRSTEFYSYSVPFELEKKIKIGQIIEINFRGKNIAGLIINIRKNKKFKYPLKEFNKVLFETPLITKSQIKLINFIAEYYLIAKSIVVKSMLPEIPKKQKIKKTKKQKNKKSKKQSFNKKLIWYVDEKKLFEELKEKIKKHRQILILVPEIGQIDYLIKNLKLKENQVLKIHGSLAKVKFFNMWLEILSGKPKIIIGTKISVFLPFANLEKIIIFDEQDWNHKQSDINPRYDARQVADWLAKEHGCELILTSPAPSVGMGLRPVRHKGKDKIKIIDLKQEQQKENYTFIADDLLEKIKENIKNNKKTFIFHNRKGWANYIFCNDCGYVFKCPECQISLIYRAQEKNLYCPVCNFSQDVSPLCPKCSKSNIKFKGQGVDKIKSEIKKLLPEIKISIFDKNNPLFESDAQIIIGTEFAVNKIDFNEFDCIAFTNFDQLLNFSDWRAQERAYQLFYKIKSQATRSEFLIQTYNPDEKVLQSIMKNSPEIFYNSQLKTRQELNYPPFIKIIKLFTYDKSEKNIIYKSKKLSLNLKNKFKNIEVLGPFENYPPKIRNKYCYNIILKTPLDFDHSQLKTTVSNDYIIDIEPEKIN